MLDILLNRQFKRMVEGFIVKRSRASHGTEPPADFLFAVDRDPKLPDEIFHRLLWGGVLIYADRNPTRVKRIAQEYDRKRGFILETPIGKIRMDRLGLRLPVICPCVYYFVARKVSLIQPGEITERFTYQVELIPDPGSEHGYIVCKQIPSHADVAYRLRVRYPDLDEQELQERVRKLVDTVFPTFLTREAAILKILQTELPEPYRRRVPKPLGVEKDSNGFVRRLAMNWLRTGGPELSQIEFAHQSATLLNVLHNNARVMHLDLRLDNFVITPDGVGFVDFGSSARIGEDIQQSPMLTSLFGEMMRTSKIQRMLGRMLDRGQVTNRSFSCVHQKADPAIDTFFLALQINKPNHNPQFAHLVEYDPHSREAQAIASLTSAVLRPKDPLRAPFQSAEDILRGVERIRRRLLNSKD